MITTELCRISRTAKCTRRLGLFDCGRCQGVAAEAFSTVFQTEVSVRLAESCAALYCETAGENVVCGDDSCTGEVRIAANIVVAGYLDYTWRCSDGDMGGRSRHKESKSSDAQKCRELVNHCDNISCTEAKEECECDNSWTRMKWLIVSVDNVDEFKIYERKECWDLNTG